MRTETETPSAVDLNRSRPFAAPTVLVALCAALGFFVLAWMQARRDSATFDEPFYICGAHEMRHGVLGSENFSPLPKLLISVGQLLAGSPGEYGVVCWNQLPWVLGEGLTAARLPFVFLGALLAFLLTLFAARHSRRAAVFTALLAATSPVLLAHGHLATLDMAMTFFFFAACWAAERVVRAESGRRRAAALVLLSLSLGLGIVSKSPALGLLGALPLGALFEARGGFKSRLQAAAWVALGCIGGLAVVALVYELTTGLLSLLTQVKLHATERGPDTAFIFNKAYEGGVWWFFLGALAIKLPLALFPLAVRGAVELRGSVLIWLPPVLLTAALTYLGGNNGVRYVLPLVALLVLLGGIGAAALSQRLGWVPALLVGACIVSSLATYPRHIQYKNELRLLSAYEGHDWLFDSDGDWGQGARALREEVVGRGLERVCVAWLGITSWKLEPELLARSAEPPNCDYAAVSPTILFSNPDFSPLLQLRPLDTRGPVFIYDIRSRPEVASAIQTANSFWPPWMKMEARWVSYEE